MAERTDYSYGRWCTIGGKRYMIVNRTSWLVFVNTPEGRKHFDKSVVSEVSDFMQTDAERAALGYAF